MSSKGSQNVQKAQTTRLFLVDDHGIARAGLKRILADVIDVQIIGEAASTQEALEILLGIGIVTPDVLLMGMRPPFRYGYASTDDLIKPLIKKFPRLKILILGNSLDELLLQHLFKEGIRGYLTHSSNVEEMIKAIRAVGKNGHYISQEFAQKISVSINSSSPRSNKSKQDQLSSFDVLSERELQIVLMLLEGLTIKNIAKRLYVNRKTVNSYRSRCFQKLGLDNDVDLTLIAFRQGIIQPGG